MKVNECDLAETKHVALQKFLELAKDPTRWEDDFGGYYKLGKFTIKWWKDGDTDITLGRASFRFNADSEYSKAVVNIHEYHVKQRAIEKDREICLALQEALFDPPKVERDEMKNKESIWQRIKNWLDKNHKEEY